MVLALVAGLVLAVIAAVVVARAGRAEQLRAASHAIDDARVEAAGTIKGAELEAAAQTKALETAARAEALELRTAAADAFEREAAAVERRAEHLGRAERELATQRDAIDQREEQLDVVQRELQARRDRAGGLERDAKQQVAAVRTQLETRAGVRGGDLIASLSQAWLEDARAGAAAALRAIDQTAADPAHDREAKRVMEIAATRYHHHYLTERAMNNLRVGPQIVAMLLDNSAAIHGALERVSGLQLLVNDEKDAIRLDGLDGVGKEMVRRAMGKLIKKPESIEDARKDPEAWSAKAREHLNQEIRALGKRAFQVLGIQKAHPEIVELVGALNFRTSYTQNQWWHAVESSYLAGMMAAELGLDEKLARRATLMHDIGKALTH
ncbi:MAG: Rnase Y domain-containing protein, partial [Kofleriaceae bacterium]